MTTDPAHPTTAITPEHQSEDIHALELGTDGMVHGPTMAIARGKGDVIDVPGVSGGLLTRRAYLAAFQEFCGARPEPQAAIQSRRRAGENREMRQPSIDSHSARSTDSKPRDDQ